ncbi:hypothetical protein B6N60_03263 [Richelia sinica FACHB-800]|uniref:Uncharacterized protein n=1 Tax=Richelia sinica FACHB-800 TaxID=1357546 RepID=A0A975T994_9NOST|nr:hypothetical protein B6N60_03263 [Richelia sinica FACHB-800]
MGDRANLAIYVLNLKLDCEKVVRVLAIIKVWRGTKPSLYSQL